jgi:hypothetical protein
LSLTCSRRSTFIVQKPPEERKTNVNKTNQPFSSS